MEFAQKLEKIVEEADKGWKEINQKRYKYSYEERSKRIREKANEQLKEYNLYIEYVNKKSVGFVTLSGSTDKGDTKKLEEYFREKFKDKAKVIWRDYYHWYASGRLRPSFLGFRDKNESKLKEFVLTSIPIIRSISQEGLIGYSLIMEPSSRRDKNNNELVDFFSLKRKPESYKILEKIMTNAYKNRD